MTYSNNIIIKEACCEDIEDILFLYEKYMFDSYFLKLGRAFVKKYLQIILESDAGISLVAKDKKTAGFIMASVNSKKIFLKILCNAEMWGIMIKQFVMQPIQTLGIFSFFSYISKTSIKNIEAELLFISIDPDYRRKKLGTELIQEVLKKIEQKGIKRIKVTSLEQNKAVIRMLEILDFKKERKFRALGKDMYLFVKDVC